MRSLLKRSGSKVSGLGNQRASWWVTKGLKSTVAPLGMRTLAYRVWERYTEGFLPDAAAAGLTLMVVALGAQLITLRWRRHV